MLLLLLLLMMMIVIIILGLKHLAHVVYVVPCDSGNKQQLIPSHLTDLHSQMRDVFTLR
jgi:hypothetical protein